MSKSVVLINKDELVGPSTAMTQLFDLWGVEHEAGIRQGPDGKEFSIHVPSDIGDFEFTFDEQGRPSSVEIHR